MSTVQLIKYYQRIEEKNLYGYVGKVTRVVGLTLEVKGIRSSIGEICEVCIPHKNRPLLCEVVGFKEGSSILMPLGRLEGIFPGCKVFPTGKTFRISVGPELLGKVVGSLGEVFEGEKLQLTGGEGSVYSDPPNPMKRKPINEKLITGIKSVDLFLTCGIGQRMGIFSGSGVGKSTLLGMIARNSSADVNVIGLIGERGREVREFIDKDLGPQGLARSVVVVATSDQPALLRVKGALVATAIAEYFRDQGKNVLLMMDSITRFATAQREIGLAVGEPPTTKGYTPSVFALLPKILERAGNMEVGSITGLYTVLVDGDDFNEPIADAVRGILDGHIVLTRKLAAQNCFPAIDIMQSVSRLMPNITSEEHQSIISQSKDIIGVYEKNADLINIGAYETGQNPEIDRAKEKYPQIINYLKQGINESFPYEESLAGLARIIG
ncbi:MAG: flagellar protein export ATPase FliI [Syntrophomonadaceae bacterium]|jgi:flagellum-specific ATP synthase